MCKLKLVQLGREFALRSGHSAYFRVLYDRDPVDIDNIIKPIQDALVGVVYEDDVLITDVDAHRRPLTGTFDLTRCPSLLIQGVVAGEECVYVRVCTSRSMEDYL